MARERFICSERLEWPNSGVYFIQSQGFVKIGFSGNIKKRFKSLQIGNPEPMRIYGVIPCGPATRRQLEDTLHRKLCRERWRGEWFRFWSKDHWFVVNYFIEKFGGTHSKEEWGEWPSRIEPAQLA